MIRLRVSPEYAYDVVIAGAGPGGASAAARLASAGVRVLVLDRQRFPRDKVCGDFVGPAALIELEALGVTHMSGYGDSNIIRQAALHSRRRRAHSPSDSGSRWTAALRTLCSTLDARCVVSRRGASCRRDGHRGRARHGL
jgi:flavin-dependent dehydrogenase